MRRPRPGPLPLPPDAATASPFDWKFTADDLNDLLARIDRHERADAARAA